MKVCYFGDYNPEYARNRVLLRGLKLNDVDVVECRVDFSDKNKKDKLINKFNALKDNFDYIIVGYSDSRFLVPLIKKLTNQPVIWDAFYSLYDSWIYDKQLRSPLSLRAAYYWWLDYKNCQLADLVLVDTKEHMKYFKKTFKLDKSKIEKLPVGTDETVFYPKVSQQNNKLFKVFFLGKFIPLQGVKYIIKAAGILQKEKDIKFQIIGRGQTYKNNIKLAADLKINNIEFVEPIPYEKIPEFISSADICLGIFGDTDKTKRVIPNKVYESVAMAKSVITADTPAIREMFTDRENILLCTRANPQDLADKILQLKNNKDLREKIAKGGYEIYKEKASTKLIGEKLIHIIENVS